MFGRIILSALTVAAYVAFKVFYLPVQTLIAGSAAGAQFAASNSAALLTTWTFAGLSAINIIAAVLFLGILLIIWLAPLKNFAKWFAPVLIFGMILMPTSSKAYYDQKDFTEAYTILPNWSAFWIPDTGDNKTDQVQFDSAAYLEKNKVAAKRFIIPHAKLSGTGSFWDFYVPAGRLILVDRTTYSHEWVDNIERGDNAKKDGFPCQSNDGINITAGVSVGAKVEEKDAAIFLYNFGVNSNLVKGSNINDPAVIFQSVYYGRSLREVMADTGRKKIQTLVCNEIGSRSFDQANKDYVSIMKTVDKNANEYFKSVGITISFIGWADTFEFDHDIQAAVNRAYVANIEAANAQKLQPYASTILALAQADALRNFGAKSDGKLPSTVVGSIPDVTSLLGAFGHFPVPTK